MRNNRKGLCVYCGSAQDDVDHIPPRSMIPEDSRAKIIQVPSCKACNNGFSRDDEYMMIWATTEGAIRSEDAKAVAAKVSRWPSKPNKHRQIKAYYRSPTPTTERTLLGRLQPRVKF